MLELSSSTKLATVSAVAQAVNSSLIRESMIESVVQVAMGTTSLSCGVVYLFEPSDERLVAVGAHGFRRGIRSGINNHSMRSRSMPSRAMRASDPIVFNVSKADGTDYFGYGAVTERERRCIVPEGIRGGIFARIGSAKEPKGVLALCSHSEEWNIDDDWLSLTAMIANQLGTGLERAQEYERTLNHLHDLNVLYEIQNILHDQNGRDNLTRALSLARSALGLNWCRLSTDGTVTQAGPGDHVYTVRIDDKHARSLTLSFSNNDADPKSAIADELARLIVNNMPDYRPKDPGYDAGDPGTMSKRAIQHIHDNLAQRFYLVQLNLSTATAAGPVEGKGYLSKALIEAKNGMADARAWMAYLGNLDRTHGSLTEDLNYLAESFSNSFVTPCDVSVSGPLSEIDQESATVLTTAAQELLHNVGKHAIASKVWVKVVVDDAEFRLAVTDNGVGGASGTEFGCGLRGIADRVAAAGGSFAIHEVPSGGTDARIVLGNDSDGPGGHVSGGRHQETLTSRRRAADH